MFIRDNLENTYEVTSNHFLSNLAGLLFLGSVFADLAPGAEWDAFARGAIEHELGVQVLPDGADYESSIPYHRLVLELFFLAARYREACGLAVPDDYRDRVVQMARFTLAYSRPDGSTMRS